MSLSGMETKISKDRAVEIASDIIYDRPGSVLGCGVPDIGQADVDGLAAPIWVVPIVADYPRHFEEFSTRSAQDIVLRLGKVAEIEIDAETGEAIRIPNRASVNRTASDKVEEIQRSVEQLLLRTANVQFARLVSVKYMLGPVQTIMTRLLRDGRFSISEVEGAGYSANYLTLLQLANVAKVERETDIVYPSSTIEELYAQFSSTMPHADAIATTIERVIQDILLNHYDFVYSELKLRQLTPYIQVSSTYYDLALSVDNLVEISEDELMQSYEETYGVTTQRRHFKFSDYLDQLSLPNVSIMKNVSEKVWRGNDEIFHGMQSSNPLKGFVSP